MVEQPSTTEVATLYDEFTDLFTEVLGGSIHLGYWEHAEDDSPVEVACDRLTDVVSARIDAAPSGALLDVGCGSGRPARRIAGGTGAYVTGVTVSRHQLRLARDLPPAAAPGRTWFTFADAMRLPFPDGSFDGAYAIESLLHMRDKDAALRHIARVLRPGGRLVVADLLLGPGPLDGEAAETVAAFSRLFRVASIVSVEDWPRRLRRAGLELVDLTDVRDNVWRGLGLAAGFFRDNAALLDGASPEGEAPFTAAESPFTPAESPFTAGEAADVIERFSRLPQAGYVLLTARKPPYPTG